MQLHSRMVGEVVTNQLGLVGGDIVQDDVDLLALGLGGNQRTEKGNELGTGMAGRRLPDHLSILGVESGVQRQRPLADVLEAVTFGPARRQGQDRVSAVEGLDCGLLVQTEYDCVLGRVHIETDNVGRLGLEVGIVGGHVAFETMWLDAGPRPDPSDSHVRDSQMLGQLAAAPMSTPVRRSLSCSRQDSSFQTTAVSAGSFALVPSVQTVQALGKESAPPSADERSAAVRLPLNRGIRQSFGEHQDDARSLHVSSSQDSGPGSTLELFAFDFGEDDLGG